MAGFLDDLLGKKDISHKEQAFSEKTKDAWDSVPAREDRDVYTSDIDHQDRSGENGEKGKIGDLSYWEDPDGFIWLDGINEPLKPKEDRNNDLFYDEEMDISEDEDARMLSESIDERIREKEDSERDFMRTWIYEGADMRGVSPYEKEFAPLDVPDDLDWDRS